MIQNIINKLITYIILFLGLISSKLSFSARKRYGEFLGDFLRILSTKRRRITLDNIRSAFPDKSHEIHQEIMKGSYRNLGITFAELLAFNSFSEDDFRNYIKFENLELFTNLYNEGKGVIVVSGHFGNWELLGYCVCLFSKIPMTIIAKPQSNNYLDGILNKYRSRSGNTFVSMYQAARTIVKTIQNGGVITLLADQSATGDKDIFIDFFGRPAATYEAPASLALKFKIPFISGFAERLENGKYYVKIYEIKHDDLEFDKKGIEELTRRHVKFLEDAIRKHPEQWVWQHRRWKHKPKNQA
jgi:Kdo2-lipid IVA lauroyltransferase/acyltransferase